MTNASYDVITESTTPQYVYEVWHCKIGPQDGWSTGNEAISPKDIGIFTSEAKARAAIDHVKDQLGFRDWPGSFRIVPVALDETMWSEGF